MADRLPTRPPRNGWGNISKNLALWLLVGLLALALFQMLSRQKGPSEEFTYTEFIHQLNNGNIQSVQVFDGKRVEGQFKEGVAQDGHKVQNFSVLLPVANDQQLITRLDSAGVQISAKEPKGGLTAILIAALPWIVIFGLWIFLLRPAAGRREPRVRVRQVEGKAAGRRHPQDHLRRCRGGR